MTTMKGLQFLIYVEIGVPVLVALKANYKLFIKGLILIWQIVGRCMAEKN